jgi:tetratricopeptide (TPR) repeat protein
VLTLSETGEEPFVTEKPGDQIGRYKLLEQIGEGGCGIVYMAQQTEPIRRRVALKIVKLGLDTKQVIARFEAERQVLALMDHPHIARVLDGGATETGRPYFVMELVRGTRITDYCDAHNLPTRERLNLFVQVCQAVQHAHQKGIIHRDIKPSNILVTLHDGVPVPKVIDFGIAKATHQELTEKTFFTSFRQFIGTPAYMSPEQAEMSGLDIDTRSDIYTLGVLLYELLTGHTPFESKKLLQAGFDEMRRMIREQEPLRPSTRFSTLDAAQQSTVAKRQQTEGPKLIHLLQGDLDWIMMKCLDKDRTRRYDTANSLASDVERHLRCEPVTAAAPSALYRTKKFVRRHRRGVATAVALILLLQAGLVWQTTRMWRAQKMARSVEEFFERSLADVRASVESGKDTTLLEEVLSNAWTRVKPELKDQPEAQAATQLGIGFMFVELHRYPPAEVAFSQARLTYTQLYGQRNPGVAASAFGLSLANLKQGKYAEAESNAREALVPGPMFLRTSQTVVAHSLNVLAAALEAQDSQNLEEAKRTWQKAIELGRKLPDGEAWILCRSLTGFGKLLERQGKCVDAEHTVQEALELSNRLPGHARLQVAELANLLAEIRDCSRKTNAISK